MDYVSEKSLWKWILLYIFIGAVAYGAIYYFFFYKTGDDVYTPQNDQTQTADWKTYKNEQYGFEISYPGTWHEVIAEDSKQSVALFSFCPNANRLCNGHDDLYVYLNIYDTHRFNSLQAVNNFIHAGVMAKEENIFVDNSPAVRTETATCSDKSLTSYSVVTGQGDYFYAMHTYSDCDQAKRSQLNDIFNRMISTFKFTK